MDGGRMFLQKIGIFLLTSKFIEAFLLFSAQKVVSQAL